MLFLYLIEENASPVQLVSFFFFFLFSFRRCVQEHSPSEGRMLLQ